MTATEPHTDAPSPLITIGITCFNAAATIRRAIASARAQDWPNVEIVVADDCSTDGSVAAIREAIAGVENARLIRLTENGGTAVASNAIIAAARGEFLAFFDDDDESAPDRIAQQCRAMIDYERRIGAEKVVCFASGARRYPNGYECEARAIGTCGRPPIGLEIVDYLLLNERRPGVDYGAGTPACAMMARTATLRAAGGFDPAMRRVGDVDLAVRLGLQGAHFIGCPQKLYLQHATTGSDKTPLRNLECELAVVEKNRDYLSSRGLYAYARGWFVFRSAFFLRRYGAAAWQVGCLLLRYPLRTLEHLMASAPARMRHEAAMRRPAERPSAE